MAFGIKDGCINLTQAKDIIDLHIYIENLENLYTETNYSSERSKALNPDLEKYILNSIQNYRLKTNIRLVIHLPMGISAQNISEIKRSFYDYFSLRAKETDSHLKRKFRQWRLNLSIGTVFLAVCLAVLEMFEGKTETNGVKLLKESLLIMGWVSLWEPITFILFGWHPILKKKMYLKKLSSTPISILKYMNRSNNNVIR
ncbi:MAG: hypothetical protein Q8930_12430 [Bacillota bacterium]|nr:hypothetical protein [Bacillota bacterium]